MIPVSYTHLTGWIRNCLEYGFDIHGKKLVIAGTGGAGTAIQIAAALGGAKKIVIFARKSSPRFANGEETVRKIREHVPECQAEIFDLEDSEALRRELAGADLFCNATKEMCIRDRHYCMKDGDQVIR